MVGLCLFFEGILELQHPTGISLLNLFCTGQAFSVQCLVHFAGEKRLNLKVHPGFGTLQGERFAVPSKLGLGFSFDLDQLVIGALHG